MIDRRNVLSGIGIAAPAVILTPGLLMPIVDPNRDVRRMDDLLLRSSWDDKHYWQEWDRNHNRWTGADTVRLDAMDREMHCRGLIRLINGVCHRV